MDPAVPVLSPSGILPAGVVAPRLYRCTAAIPMQHPWPLDDGCDASCVATRQAAFRYLRSRLQRLRE
jgi:hypothetical protein